MTRPQRITAAALAFVLAVVGSASAQPADDNGPAPPTEVAARNYWGDKGDQIIVTWVASTDASVVGYAVYRSMTDAEITKADRLGRAKAIASARRVATTELLDEDWDSDTIAALTAERRAAVRTARADAAAAAGASADAASEAVKGKPRFLFLSNILNKKDLKKKVPKKKVTYTATKLGSGQPYEFQVEALTGDGRRSPRVATAALATPTGEPFDSTRFYLAIIVLIFCGAVILFILLARRGRPLKVRKIGGLAAVEEAVGRATEMGRSILFIPGIQDVNDIQTVAGISILSRVAKLAAEYDAKIEVPTARALVMTAAREAVQAAYLGVGRPDAYDADLIHYITNEQFGYVAYVSGQMVREKPAACFYMGAFFAESLILAETGNAIGAIQIAGTAQPAQLPFFVAACDYTLIGEEFFAASAYLSGSPEELGSLKGQDVGKLLVGVIVLIGVGLATLASALDSDAITGAVEYLRSTILT